MAAVLLLTVMLSGVGTVCPSSLFADLAVARGRSSCLQPDSVRINLKPGEFCRVQVIRGRYLDHTVGSIYPKTFNCSLKEGEVCYQHSGTPHLTSDLVPLRVVRYHADTSTAQLHYLYVQLQNMPFNFIDNKESWSVPSMNTISNGLCSSGFQLKYSSLDTNCYMTLNPQMSEYPVVGYIMGVPQTRTNVSKTVTGSGVLKQFQKCSEFLLKDYKYRYTDVLNLKYDYVPMEFQLTSSLGKEQSERYFVPVQLNSNGENRSPKVTLKNRYVLRVKPFATRILDPEFALAVDDTTPQDAIHFIIQNISHPAFGYFAYRHNPSKPVLSFSQAEVRSHQVVFKSMKDDHNDKPVHVQMVAVDLEFGVSSEIHLSVQSGDYNTRNIEVHLVNPVRIPMGASAKVTKDHLRIKVSGKRDITFVVRDGLYYGTLWIKGRKVQKFHPEDLESGRIVYKHNGESSASDYILMRVKDGKKKRARVTLPINIVQIANNPPLLVNNTAMKCKEGQMAPITGINLATNTANMSKIIFIITKTPTNGRISKLVGTQFVNNVLEFSGEDIMSNAIFYKHVASVDTNNNDEFFFRMVDGSGAQSVDHKFKVKIETAFGKLERLSSVYNSLVSKWQTPTVLTKNNIRYSSSNGPVRYDISKQPFSRGRVQSNRCGKIVLYTDRHKASSIAYQMLDPVFKFTQEDIDSGNIIYVSPLTRPTFPLELTFSFDVHDSTGNSMVNQLYNITVNDPNKSPQWMVEILNPLIVHEGESVSIRRDDFNITTLGDHMPHLTFKVVQKPQWGLIEKWLSKSVKEENWDSFTLTDLNEKAIIYQQEKHSGTEPMADSVQLLVSDGSVTFGPVGLDLIVIPRNDEAPRVHDDDLHVEEGGTLVITKDTLPVKDLDIPEDKLRVQVTEQPKFGKLILKRVDNKTGEYVVEPVLKFVKQSLGKDILLTYKHDGSENFADKFKVKVTDSVYENQGYVQIKIKAVNDEIPEIVVNAELAVQKGESVEISKNELNAVDRDNNNEEIFYLISQLPTNGKLQKNRVRDDGVYLRSALHAHWQNFKLGQNFTQEDINEGYVRYASLSDNKEEHSNIIDQFVFIVSDGAHALPHATFKILVNQTKDNPSTPIINENQNEQRYDPNDLNKIIEKATDAPDIFKLGKSQQSKGRKEDNEFEDDVWEDILDDDIEEAPEELKLLQTTKEPRGIIDWDSEEDDDDELEGPTPPSPDEDDYLYLFGQAPPTDTVTKSDDSNLKLPNLVTNSPLNLRNGGTGVLSKKNLRISQPGTDATSLKYVIVKRAEHGVLFRELHEVNSYFTQNDINKEHITYKHIKDQGTDDEIVFRVTDGIHDRFLVNGTLAMRTVVFNINIKRPADVPPTLTFPRKFDQLERLGRNRYAYRLSKENLLARHPDALSDEITYAVENRPEVGYLEYVSNGRIVNRRFTQKDIDKADIRYVINPKSDWSNDTFVVNLMDPWGHISKDYSVSLSWPVVQFIQAEYIVCEDVQSFNIAIRRSGNVDQSCSVQVKIKSMTAKVKEDFIVDGDKTLKFQPGESLLGWKIRVRQDIKRESTEKFRVMLRAPSNTVIGPIHKTVVHLVDFKNGRCDQYLGMISKDEPNPLGIVFQPKAKSKAKVDLTTNVPVTLVRGTEEPHPTWFAPLDEEEKPQRKGRGKKTRNRKKPDIITTTTTATSTTTEYQPRSQACTPRRKGLVFFDMVTQNLFKCDGLRWLRQYHRYMFMPQNPPAPEEEVYECPYEWEQFKGHCYFLHKPKVSWFTSHKDCTEEYGAHIVTIQNKEQLNWLTKFAGFKHFWTGVNNRNSATWVNEDGEKKMLIHWKSGYPKKPKQRNCVLVNHKGHMVNKPCHRSIAQYICYKPLKAGSY